MNQHSKDLRAALDRFLAGYFHDFGFRTVTTAEFEAYLRAKLLARHPDARVQWHNWWNAPRTWAAVQATDELASHASWMENFPWTRLAGVALPRDQKVVVEGVNLVTKNVKPSPANPQGGQLLKRLQSEAQMLFYTHAVHDEREAARLHPINGFWVSGAGALAQPLTLRPAPAQPDTLRQAALQADWRRWQQAWEALDAGEIAQWLARARRGEAITLTLCGERAAQRFTSAPRTAAGRIGRLFKNILGQNPAWKTLESL